MDQAFNFKMAVADLIILRMEMNRIEENVLLIYVLFNAREGAFYDIFNASHSRGFRYDKTRVRVH